MKKIAKIHLLVLFITSLFCLSVFGVCRAEAATCEIRVSAGDTRALMNALNEAGSNATASAPYKIILTPNSTYNITADLHIYSNTTLYARGATLVSVNGGNMLKVGGNEDPVRGYGYQNITVDGGTWNGGGNSSTMMKVCHVKNFLLCNATMQNCKNAHMVEMAGADGVKIYNCSFKDHVNNYKSRATEVIQIDILESHHINGYQYLDQEMDLLCKNVTVDKCTFTNCSRGVGSHTQVIGRYFENIRITNNVFTGLKDVAICCRSYKNSAVIGNKVSSDATAVEVCNISVEGNGAFVSRSTPSISNNVVIPNCNVVVKNNTLTSGNDIAVRLLGNKYTSSKKTVIKLNSGTESGDVVPKGDYYLNGVTVENNVISGKGDYPVRVTFAKNINIRNNKIYAPGQKAAIGCYNGGDSTINIVGNTITGAPQKGITVFTLTESKKAMGNSVVGSISKNIMTDVKGNAIHITDAKAGHVDGNKISGKACTGGVFSARAIITSISGNVVKNVKGQGIYMSSNSVVGKVDKNTIKKTGKEGILLTSQSQVTSVSKNKITKPGSHGIKLGGAKKKKIKVLSNKVSGKKSATGIWVQAGKATVNKNTLTGFGVGIRTNKSMTGKLKGNKFKKCKKNIS